jgi:hypothetical protein
MRGIGPKGLAASNLNVSARKDRNPSGGLLDNGATQHRSLGALADSLLEVKGVAVSKLLMVSVLGVYLVGCAHEAPKTVPATATPPATEEQQVEDGQLTAQLKRKDIREYVCYLCGLPQPERWETAKALLADNRVLASCAFDKDHLIPEDQMYGPIATIPACPIEPAHSAQ